MKKPVLTEGPRTLGVESQPMVITSHATKTIVNHTADGTNKYIIVADGTRVHMSIPTEGSPYRYPVNPTGRDLLRAIADGINEVLAVPVVEVAQ